MRHLSHLSTMVLVIVLVIATGAPAQAGLFKRSKKQDKKEMKAQRYDRKPSMDFASGTMYHGALVNWQGGETRVQLKKQCAVVGSDGEPTRLRGGDRVVIMGPRVANTIVAWQIRVVDSGMRFPESNPEENVRWSDVDPTVGEGTGPE